MENSNPKTGIKIISALVVIAALGYGIFQYGRPTKDNTQATTPIPTPITTPPPPATISTKYKDGTYQVTGNYTSPAAKEEITITLVLKDDIVTSATFAGSPKPSPTTIKMQEKFSTGFKEFVIGKNIDEISLTVVNGSSLTPIGFMDALAKIKAEALI